MIKSILSLILFCQLVLFAQPEEAVSGFSIVAFDSVTGDLGIAVQSKFLGAGAIVPYAKAGVGAIATQSHANTTYGGDGLGLLAKGYTAQQAVEYLIQSDTSISRRQVGIVDAKGNSFCYTGSGCMQYAGHLSGRGYTVQGNALSGSDALLVIAKTFEFSSGDLALRLLDALHAVEKSVGTKQRKQSAALLVVRENAGYGGYNDRFVDIRVDSDSLPVIELRRLYNLWQETFLFEARLRSIDEFNRKKQFIAADIEKKRLAVGFNAQLRDKPDDPDVLNKLAWILATNQIDKVQALELAKRAALLSKGRLEILNTLAECHFQLNHLDEAIAIQSELVAKEPSNDSFWKQLQKFKEAKAAIR